MTKRSSIEDAAMGYAADDLAQEIKDLIVNAERPDLMFIFLNVAIEAYAAIVATHADPDIVAQKTKAFIDDGGVGSFCACAKHILLKREADYLAAEAGGA
jgi:hypothetical protein